MHYMDFVPMNEEEMIEYLGEMENMETSIPKMILETSNSVESLDECICRNSLPGVHDDDAGVPNGSSMKPDKVLNTLLSVYRDMEQQSDETSQELQWLYAAWDKLNYVKRCINLLKVTQQNLITNVFIKKVDVEEYAKKCGVSRSAIYNMRKDALKNLLAYYNRRFSRTQSKVMVPVDSENQSKA